MNLESPPAGVKALRCVNIVNFIRGVEPRFETDLLLPVKEQMKLIKQHGFPATWLLQYDALVSGPFVEFLKANAAPNHEIGFWFEMNQMHCEAAGVNWRGRPGFEWDHYPLVAFTIGYTKEERVKLADAAMAKFKEIWGYHPSSVASWNLDSFTIAHLVEKYGVDAFAVCRDQIATDGFTIWGAPIAGYYPSKNNCWSPAVDRKNQINAPVFRMLGQDPVYYYQRQWKMPIGKIESFPDTMEPVWPSGRSDRFVETFLAMIESAPSQRFSYVQMGQENSFPWRDQAQAYPKQMDALAKLVQKKSVVLETMGDSGRRFKKAFKKTPPQAQVQLEDPYGNTESPQTSVWYQSRHYRANVHLMNGIAYLRDIFVYRDGHKQPYLDEPTKLSSVEQRQLGVVDGFHWSPKQGSLTEKGAGGYLKVDGAEFRPVGRPEVSETPNSLSCRLKDEAGRWLLFVFEEDRMSVSCAGKLEIEFFWDKSKSAFKSAFGGMLDYVDDGFGYSVRLLKGSVQTADSGCVLTSEKSEIKMVLSG